MANSLSIKELKFINGILAGWDNAAAYLKAYKCKKSSSARAGGYRLTHSVPHVMAEIDRRKKELAKKGDYNFDKAMSELHAASEFAKATDNATALARTIELKAKLSGLMIERVDQRQVADFNLHISGIDDDSINVNPEPNEFIEESSEVDIFS